MSILYSWLVRNELIVFIQLLIMRPLANIVVIVVVVSVPVVLASDAPLNEHQVRFWAVSGGI